MINAAGSAKIPNTKKRKKLFPLSHHHNDERERTDHHSGERYNGELRNGGALHNGDEIHPDVACAACGVVMTITR